LSFDGVVIEPIENYADGLNYINQYGCEDGYIYPPQIHTKSTDIETGETVDVPNSTRPAQMYLLPASHSIYIQNPISVEKLRFEDAGLIVHLLAFFFGTRLQFSDWMFDGRVPIKSANSFSYAEATPQRFFSSVYQAWKNWTPELRKRYINILYVHGKAKCCEQDWESFLYQYMVFDAIYKFYILSGGMEINGHKKRLTGLCENYGIPHHVDHINEIYKLRNELFHEALWNGNTPGFSLGSEYQSAQWLERLNSKLIVAIAGYTNDFVKTGWWTYGWQSFNQSFTMQSHGYVRQRRLA
jgi:hypothetical protein